VPSLKVNNQADLPVLFVEGQTLIGGDQNRTMNVSVLLPAKTTTDVPVSCVEAHRWGAGSREAYRSEYKVVPGSLRSAKISGLDYSQLMKIRRRSDQGLVWEEVDRLETGHGYRSGTASLDDLQERVEGGLAPDLDRVTPQARQVGVVCMAGDRLIGLDLFDKASTLAQYLRAIVAGHTLDVWSAAQVRENDPVQAIEDFLAQVERATREKAGAVGLGEEIVMHDPVEGVGLEVEGRLVHLAAFPDSAGPRERRLSHALL
jgi:ARG/rhodanese/phosphatase superfamily protein